MTTSDATEYGTLPMLDDWLKQLTASQRNLLRAHVGDQQLPADVVDLICTGPLSPMRATDWPAGTTGVHMPPAIASALGDAMEPEDTSD
jgi:hypothetical protein